MSLPGKLFGSYPRQKASVQSVSLVSFFFFQTEIIVFLDSARRAAKDAKDAPSQPAPERARVDIRKFVKIGRPGYKVTKQRDPESGQQSLLFQVSNQVIWNLNLGFTLLQIDYPEIVDNIVPRHRFMAAYEQRVEPPDKKWQYLLFAAEPYETIAFKVRG